MAWIAGAALLAAVFAVGLAMGRRNRRASTPVHFTQSTFGGADHWAGPAPLDSWTASPGSQGVPAADLDGVKKAILDAVRAGGSTQMSLAELSATTGIDEQRLRAHLLALDGEAFVEQSVETWSVKF